MIIPLLAALSANPLISGVIALFIYGIVIGILIWLVSIAPFIPDPFKKVLTFILYAVAAILLINFLLGLVGHSFIAF